MNITDATKASRHFRQYRKCLSLIQSIESRLAWYLKHMPDRVSPAHIAGAQRTCAQLTQISQIITRLDSNELKSHTLKYGPRYDDLIRRPTRDLLWDVFHTLPQPRPGQKTVMEQSIIDLMTEAGRNQRAEAHKAALMYEIAYRAAQGWYMIFNTLTVEDGNYNKVFTKDGAPFRDYIRHVSRLSAQASYGSIRNAIGKEHHTYFAVIEEGAKNGRLHIHVLHALQNLPKGSRDPNRALAIPYRRELSSLKALWPYGTSSPLMVRYSPLDAFGKAGYRWPYDTKKEKPMLVKSPLAIAGYMSKYIVKSYVSPKRSKLLWRVRKTQRLGNALIQELLSTLTPPQLLAVANCPSLNLKLNNKKIPAQLLRLQALLAYSRLSTVDNPSLLAICKDLQPALSPLRAWRASNPNGRTFNPQKTGSTKTETIKGEDISDATWETLKAASSELSNRYLRVSTKPSGTTSTRDLIFS